MPFKQRPGAVNGWRENANRSPERCGDPRRAGRLAIFLVAVKRSALPGFGSIVDWGITPLRDQDRRDLLEVIDDRDGRRSSVLASQIPVSQWHDYVGDPTVADAIADRLLYNAHRIVLKGPSRRAPKDKEATQAD